MKTLSCFLYAVILVGPSFAPPDDESVKLFEHVSREFTTEWYASLGQIVKSPQWDPLSGDPPLSVSNAVSTASRWIEREIGLSRWDAISAHPDLVQRIALRSLTEEKDSFAHFYYYTIVFRTGYFDSQACIVLMDGSVLEPKRPGTSNSTKPATRARGRTKAQKE